MVRFKSFNEVILSMLERFRLTQPQLDTKPGTVARDLFVDGQAFEVSDVYELLQEIASLQSIANMTGDNLTNYGFNFGAVRKTGTKSNGQVVLTFRNIDVDTTIPAESTVSTRNGLTFTTISSVTAQTSDANALRATATRLREELDIAGITDQFALEVTVQAQNIGSSGNIASYSIVSHNIAGVNSVTNVSSFSGGSDLENDAAFRSRILATFAGANTGTSLGYRSLVLALADSLDALVVEPGDVLMTRDGTTTTTDSDGNTIVLESGTGGKVDIYVLGENLQDATDSFIYQDSSGRNDPTDSSNDFILGQSSLTPETTLSLNSRRVGVLSEGQDIPTQPASSLVSVSGSSSGPNFIEQYEDEVGNLQGNYKLSKDTGSAAGSPFGLDKLIWTSDEIELTGESRTKGAFNTIDSLSFADVQKVNAVTRDVRVTNENSSVSTSSRETVTLKHTPIRSVSRVFNLTTGERYTISDQNPDGQAGETNTSGNIEISGRTLPTSSDILQVDYIWIMSFDADVNFDTMDPQDILNSSQDSIDWGFPNYIRDEYGVANIDDYGNLSVTASYPVSRTLSVNTFVREASTVTVSGSRKLVTVGASVSNIHSIIDSSQNGAEVYNTNSANGTFSNLLITLPDDTIAESGDSVTVTYNLNDLTDVDGYDSGTALNRTISILPSNATTSGTSLLVNYVANLENFLPSNELLDLPISSDGYNSFSEDSDGYQPFLDTFTSGSVTANARRTPSELKITLSNIPNAGIVEVVGTTFNLVSGEVYTATQPDVFDFAPLIREAEGLSRNASVTSLGIDVVRVMKLEKVNLNIADLVESVAYEYDLTNYSLGTNRWDKAHALEVSSLSNTSVQLAATEDNEDNPVTTGAYIRATFYYTKTNDSEQTYFSKSGSLFTNKVFSKILSIDIASGFADSSGNVSGKIVIDSMIQPEQNSTYLVDYDYTAPKPNERITVNYQYNKLIPDATLAIEEGRPITADVLAKAATKVELDVEASIIVTPEFTTSSETVRQDVADNISATLNAIALATTLDSSDIVNNAYNVEGLDRITISRFNKSESTGTVLSVTAGKNEYLAAGSVTVTVEER
jgi:uncharacterized phage protein gp47/JayE